ncbi:hypothetical protein GN244_ATG02612 [Phytophthora infestans]|uniref:Secreted RxLR effector peptide protein n=1 Tax=Phytophthora infestans TaxID=4787 RepID=A0A833WLG5_PHYIN|nr:hypothetical protein GN244_ATG02612 [Phytophthora infestans]KAF4141684.1 hypothetical protein GN958_ATG09131 [Phytophthora infestans]KAI9996613.1 hypothetical protein PInf_014350 [Phytophthora infestans]
MRLGTFFVLLVATFFACFTSAEDLSVFTVDGGERESRRLRSEAVNKDNVAKIAGAFISHGNEVATLQKAFRMANDAAVKKDKTAAKRAMQLAIGAKQGAKLSDESMGKLSSMLAQTAQKNPKSWPRLRKFVKLSLGAGVGGLAIYGAYKLMFNKGSSEASTTTTGSA